MLKTDPCTKALLLVPARVPSALLLSWQRGEQPRKRLLVTLKSPSFTKCLCLEKLREGGAGAVVKREISEPQGWISSVSMTAAPEQPESVGKGLAGRAAPAGHRLPAGEIVPETRPLSRVFLPSAVDCLKKCKLAGEPETVTIPNFCINLSFPL